ncbi:MAG: hypothetical protein C0392_04855 [Syntrophus sp. (in: bacteria)]|nr:hypothetical protein [Syntrophus sp. (in: bacteria)]
MQSKRIICYICMSMFVSGLLGGCGAKVMSEYKYSGFLSDYSHLKPALDKSGAEVYLKADLDLKSYNKVLLDRIIVWYSHDADYKGIDPTELKALTDYFHEAVVKALGSDYPVVTEPGPGVLRIRIAITELVATKPLASVVVLVTPYATIADLASGAVTKGGVGSSPYVGDAAIEVEFLDGQTNEQLIAYVERRIGKKYNVDLSEGPVKAVSTGAVSYGKAYTTWGYTKDAFDYWAKKLRKRLDEAHGKVQSK